MPPDIEEPPAPTGGSSQAPLSTDLGTIPQALAILPDAIEHRPHRQPGPIEQAAEDRTMTGRFVASRNARGAWRISRDPLLAAEQLAGALGGREAALTWAHGIIEALS